MARTAMHPGRARGGMLAFALVVVVLTCIAALIIPREGSVPTNASREAAGPVEEGDRGTDVERSSSPTVGFAELFRSGFEQLAGGLCRSIMGRASGCDAAELVRSIGAAGVSARLEDEFPATRERVRPWLHRISALPRFPEKEHAGIARYLANEVAGQRGPFAAAVALEVYRFVPTLAPRGLLCSLSSDPLLGIDFIRFHALDTLAVAPAAGDFACLRTLLQDPDTRLSRRALRGLARTAAGKAEIASLIQHLGGRLPPELARELPDVLIDSGLAGDERTVAALLTSGDEDSTRAALRGYTWDGRDEPAGPPDGVLTHLSRIAVEADDELATGAVGALGTAGERGAPVLREIAGSPRVRLRTRLRALSTLADNDDAAASPAALELLAEAQSGSDAALAIRVAAMNVDAGDEGRLRALVEAARRWLGSRPDQRDELEAGLSTSRSPVVGDVLAAIRDE